MAIEVAEGIVKSWGHFAAGIIICHDALVLYDPVKFEKSMRELRVEIY